MTDGDTSVQGSEKLLYGKSFVFNRKRDVTVTNRSSCVSIVPHRDRDRYYSFFVWSRRRTVETELERFVTVTSRFRFKNERFTVNV
jgi:hypothetical protein